MSGKCLLLLLMRTFFLTSGTSNSEQLVINSYLDLSFSFEKVMTSVCLV